MPEKRADTWTAPKPGNIPDGEPSHSCVSDTLDHRKLGEAIGTLFNEDGDSQVNGRFNKEIWRISQSHYKGERPQEKVQKMQCFVWKAVYDEISSGQLSYEN